MTRTPVRLALWAAAFCLLASPGFAQQPAAPAAAAVNPEIEAIRKASQAYVTALGRGDLQALLAAWLPGGDVIDAYGQRRLAADLLKQEFGQQQATAPNAANEPIAADANTTIRLLSDHVAIEDGVISNTGRYTAVWVKHKNAWLLASLREAALLQHPHTSPLDQLEWVIGDWVGEAGDLQYVFTGRWDAGRHFIIRELHVKRGADVLMSATQRIGWDSTNKYIRSWSFDSEGGYGEGAWVNDGDTWYVKTKGALADGREIGSTSTFTLNNDGTLTWRVEGTALREEVGPELTVTLKRPAAPAE